MKSFYNIHEAAKILGTNKQRLYKIRSSHDRNDPYFVESTKISARNIRYSCDSLSKKLKSMGISDDKITEILNSFDEK